MFRTKLTDRNLPDYTRREEIFNMVSHIVGGGVGVLAVIACVLVAAFNHNVWGVVSGAIYGFTVILLFTMSSIYHGLKSEMAKKVFQVIDHCTIYILIAGTYTPILLNKFREVYPFDAWMIFGIIWGLAIFGIVLNSIDLKRFKVLSLISYVGMGWLCVFRIQRLMEVLGGTFFVFLLVGGVFYTAGAGIYALGKRSGKRYMHSVFHIFVDVAAIMHALGIIIFIMPG